MSVILERQSIWIEIFVEHKRFVEIFQQRKGEQAVEEGTGCGRVAGGPGQVPTSGGKHRPSLTRLRAPWSVYATCPVWPLLRGRCG